MHGWLACSWADLIMLNKTRDSKPRPPRSPNSGVVDLFLESTPFFYLRKVGVVLASLRIAHIVAGPQALTLAQGAWRLLKSSVLQAARKGRRVPARRRGGMVPATCPQRPLGRPNPWGDDPRVFLVVLAR